MKKLRIDFMFAAALILGGGLAVANDAMTNVPNVYNATPDGPSETWTPLPAGGIECEEHEEINCKAFRNSEGALSDFEKGRAQ
ncbi:hypothetical protein DSL64_21530 [Dyadobacter luteus]|uniref:Uncharacterized protein n=1 Tax=Dyadobacter luteus TaxID=2259619 RepID=A0A3D8Y9F7_9BACT|nr:hypothetical protein [Dyadobacter luteus]REA58192.1 hypothetical protein DSL64_21530 [Dyadobacter luteus]